MRIRGKRKEEECMRFQTKMIVGYTILMFALALFLGIEFSRIEVKTQEEREKNNLQITANQITAQMEERLGRMEASMNYVLSNSMIRDGIMILGKKEKESGDNRLESEARANIKKEINTDFVTSSCYRMIIFNPNGDIFTTYNALSGRVIESIDMETLPYLAEAAKRNGKPVIVSAHEDVWGYQTRPEVYSLVKAVQGYRAGWIETQALTKELSEFQVSQEETDYMLFADDAGVLFSSREELQKEDYQEILAQPGNKVVKDAEHKQLVAKASSKKYGITVLCMESMKDLWDYSYNKFTPFLIALLFFIVSMLFVVALSQILTKPLRQLRTVMTNTKLDNLSSQVLIDTPNDEIEALSVSYQELLERLKKAIVKEKQLVTLSLQAQFDSLQAQVNPHFMYNVLNIISARGIANGDDSIYEMCGSLAAMLRYSTSNLSRMATIAEDVEYLNQYFYLLKVRYEHKLEYSVQIAPEIQGQLIPKVTLQQIVENSINHGFQNSAGKMRVEISGWQEGEYWYVRIHDNGQGFEEDTLRHLEEKMEQTRNKILENKDNMQLEIGGLGLINTYARCLLLYNGDIIFDLRNTADGAEVTIGGYIRPNNGG